MLPIRSLTLIENTRKLRGKKRKERENENPKAITTVNGENERRVNDEKPIYSSFHAVVVVLLINLRAVGEFQTTPCSKQLEREFLLTSPCFSLFCGARLLSSPLNS